MRLHEARLGVSGWNGDAKKRKALTLNEGLDAYEERLVREGEEKMGLRVRKRFRRSV